MKRLQVVGITKEELARCAELAVKDSGSVFMESFGSPKVSYTRNSATLSYKDPEGWEIPRDFKGGVVSDFKMRSATVEFKQTPNAIYTNVHMLIMVQATVPLKKHGNKTDHYIELKASISEENKYSSMEVAIDKTADLILKGGKDLRQSMKEQFKSYLNAVSEATEWFRDKI